jgi:hypothetical protein
MNLGFIPPKMDGKRHELRVELTKEAQSRKYKGFDFGFAPSTFQFQHPMARSKLAFAFTVFEGQSLAKG